MQIFRAGMQKEMHMSIDQSGKQRGVAEIDDLRALRTIDRFANGADAVAFNQHLTRPEHHAGIDL